MKINISKSKFSAAAGICGQVTEGSTDLEALLDQRPIGQTRAILHELSFDPEAPVATTVSSLVTNGFTIRLKEHVHGRRTYTSDTVIECADMGAIAYAALKSIKAVKEYVATISDNVQQTIDSNTASAFMYLGVNAASPDWATTFDTSIAKLEGILRGTGVLKNWKRVIDKYFGIKFQDIKGTRVVVLSYLNAFQISIAGVQNTGYLVTNTVSGVATQAVDFIQTAYIALGESESHTQVIRDMIDTKIVNFDMPKSTLTSEWNDYKLSIKNMFKGGTPGPSNHDTLETKTDSVSPMFYWVSGQYSAKPIYCYNKSDQIDSDLLYGFGVQRLTVVGSTIPDYIDVPCVFSLCRITVVSESNNNVWDMTMAAGRPNVDLENDQNEVAFMGFLASHPDMYDIAVRHVLTSGGDNEGVVVSALPENYGVMMADENYIDWNITYSVMLSLYDYWDMAKELRQGKEPGKTDKQ